MSEVFDWVVYGLAGIAFVIGAIFEWRRDRRIEARQEHEIEVLKARVEALEGAVMELASWHDRVTRAG